VPITVTALSVVPVKGMRVSAVEEVQLEPQGARGDRAYLVVDADGALLETTRTPALLAVVAAYDPEPGTLCLRFPDGSRTEAVPEPHGAASTRLYDGREVTGRLVDGPLGEALSEHLGRGVRLLARDAAHTGADDAPVTLMSEASLRALAPALGGMPDGRRFRMTLTVDGIDAWEEHGWAGRELRVGAAALRVVEPVPRCVVTMRDPDDGRTDAPVLKALARLRGSHDVTFGVWCVVTRPGTVRRGDVLEPA